MRRQPSQMWAHALAYLEWLSFLFLFFAFLLRLNLILVPMLTLPWSLQPKVLPFPLLQLKRFLVSAMYFFPVTSEHMSTWTCFVMVSVYTRTTCNLGRLFVERFCCLKQPGLHSFTPQVLIRWLLGTRYYSRHWGYSSEQVRKNSCSYKAHILGKREMDNEQIIVR